LRRLGREAEARAAFERAASLTDAAPSGAATRLVEARDQPRLEIVPVAR
jgi:hypothetical protein